VPETQHSYAPWFDFLRSPIMSFQGLALTGLLLFLLTSCKFFIVPTLSNPQNWGKEGSENYEFSGLRASIKAKAVSVFGVTRKTLTALRGLTTARRLTVRVC
jgi:hypothetical protein